jgi:hypothetical protein
MNTKTRPGKDPLSVQDNRLDPQKERQTDSSGSFIASGKAVNLPNSETVYDQTGTPVPVNPDSLTGENPETQKLGSNPSQPYFSLESIPEVPSETRTEVFINLGLSERFKTNEFPI